MNNQSVIYTKMTRMSIGLISSVSDALSVCLVCCDPAIVMQGSNSLSHVSSPYRDAIHHQDRLIDRIGISLLIIVVLTTCFWE